MSLLYRIGSKPIIAAVRHPRETEKALESHVDNLFFMGGNVQDVARAVRAASDAGKGAFIHLDLVRGLSSTDKEVLPFIVEYMGADGIITPKSHLIKEAGSVGLHAILHLFVLDSQALLNGLKLVRSVKPDAIELMPGIVGKVVSRFADEFANIPVIASGLIETREEAAEMLQAGATSLSVSSPDLWSLTFADMQQIR